MPENPATQEFHAAVDRIEGGVAVLLLGRDPIYTFRLPASLLPAGAREGEILHCTLARDPDATDSAVARNAALLQSLLAAPTDPQNTP